MTLSSVAALADKGPDAPGSMSLRLFALGVITALSLTACDKKETSATAPVASDTAPPAASAPAAAPATTAPTVELATIPVEEQYEAEAEKEITADNLSAKLDEIEKELSKP